MPAKPKQLATQPDVSSGAIENALINNDLSGLTIEQRLSYYKQVCESLSLNPLTKPFGYIVLNGSLRLYALKDCTEQLRNLREVSIEIKTRETVEGCYVVVAAATMPSGRRDESIGAVPLDVARGGETFPLVGEARANALMKCETKAKRRVTLSICGLGVLDETELDSIPGAMRVDETYQPTPQQREEQAQANVMQAIENRVTANPPTGTTCPQCGEPQVSSPQGVTCKYGHVNPAPQVQTAADGEKTLTDWRTVECHLGKANGPFLGKTMAEICGPEVKLKTAIKLLDFMEAEFMPSLESAAALGTRKGNMQDVRLLDAIKLARFALDKRIAEETPKPEERKSEPSLVESEPVKPAATKLTDWRDVPIPFECKLKGHPLGKLPPIGDCHPIAILTAIGEQLLGSETVLKTVDAKTAAHCKAAYAIALTELGIEPPLKKGEILKVLRDKVQDLIVSEDTFCERMEDYAVLPKTKPVAKRHLANYELDDLRNIIRLWPEVVTSIKAEFNS